MDNNNICIVGFGGNSKVIIDLCIELGYNIIGIYDDDLKKINQEYRNCKVIGSCDNLIGHNDCCIVLSIGNIDVRKKYYDLLKNKFCFPNIISPRAYVSESAELGIGNIIYNFSNINSCAKIGNLNLINTFSNLEHDCTIGDFNNISPNTNICGTCHIGSNNFIGASTVIRNNIKIGDNNIIGCGSIIVKDIGNNCKGFGNPFCKR